MRGLVTDFSGAGPKGRGLCLRFPAAIDAVDSQLGIFGASFMQIVAGRFAGAMGSEPDATVSRLSGFWSTVVRLLPGVGT